MSSFTQRNELCITFGCKYIGGSCTRCGKEQEEETESDSFLGMIHHANANRND